MSDQERSNLKALSSLLDSEVKWNSQIIKKKTPNSLKEEKQK